MLMRELNLKYARKPLLVIACVMRMLFIINYLKYKIMNIEININDYLSEEEKKRTCYTDF